MFVFQPSWLVLTLALAAAMPDNRVWHYLPRKSRGARLQRVPAPAKKPTKEIAPPCRHSLVYLNPDSDNL